MNILNNGRFGLGAGSASQLRRMIKEVAEHATTRQQVGHSFHASWRLAAFILHSCREFDLMLRLVVVWQDALRVPVDSREVCADGVGRLCLREYRLHDDWDD